jgi:hypothetical protein
MFTLDKIKNLVKNNSYFKSKTLAKKIINLKYSKKAMIISSFPIFFVLNAITAIVSIDLIQSDHLLLGCIFSLFFFMLINALSFVASSFMHLAYNSLIGTNSIRKIYHKDLMLPYKNKEIKEIIKTYKNLDEDSKILINTINLENLDNIEDTIKILLIEYIYKTENKIILNEKNEIIDIAKKQLNNERQHEIFKIIEEIIIDKNKNNRDNKEILNNIDYLEGNKISYKNKNIVIKNI